jgi:hypothetical protein
MTASILVVSRVEPLGWPPNTTRCFVSFHGAGVVFPTHAALNVSAVSVELSVSITERNAADWPDG